MANIPLEQQLGYTGVQTLGTGTPYAPATQPPVPTVATAGVAGAPAAGLNPLQQQTTLTGGATGTGTPVLSAVPSYSLPSLDGSNYVAQATGNPGAPAAVPQAQAGQLAYAGNTATGALDSTAALGSVMGNLNGILDSGNSYMQNAALRGVEQAGARGLRNSSIAAGNSTRSAIEAAMPILNEVQNLQGAREGQAFQGTQAEYARQLEADAQNASMQQQTNLANAGLEADMLRQREQLSFQGEQAQLGRIQDINNAMLDFEFKRSLQDNAVLQQDWLESQSYTREFNGQLAALPIQNAASLANMIANYAIANPEIYTPETISGMQSFFTGSFNSVLQQYFPNTYGAATTTAGGS